MQKRSYLTLIVLLLTLSGPLIALATVHEALKNTANFLNTKFADRNQPIIVQFIEDTHTPTNKPQYNFSSNNRYLNLQIKYHPEINKNNRKLMELMELSNVVSYKRLGTPFQLLEIASNANKGDLFAQHDLLALEMDAKTILLHAYNINDFSMYRYHSKILNERLITNEETQLAISELQSEIEKLQIKMTQILDEAKKIERQGLKKREIRLRNTKILEIFEAQEEKLNDLILKNDRKGVRQMIEAYLPFEVMSPVELDYWKQWLEALENPRPELAVVSFRGLDRTNDKIQKLEVHGKTRYGFLPTLLTKNQGSYTRRLRSLPTSRKKIGIQDRQGVGDLLKSSGIVAAARNHSQNPFGSPFLSTTPNIGIALTFANDGIAAFRIDRRRLFVDIASIYAKAEIEYLVPMVVFPDEVVAIETWNGDDEVDKNKHRIEFERVTAPLILEVGTNDSPVEYQKMGLESLKPLTDKLTPILCKEVLQ